MKKILVVLSLICFIGVNISKAQSAAATTATKQETKTEASAVQPADAPAMHSCSQHAACCKNKTASNSKECTPAQKASYDKMGSKAKTETEAKAKGSN